MRPWPHGVPRLYPKLTRRAMSEMIDDEWYEYLMTVPIVEVLPFIDGELEPSERFAALGLSRVVRRNLHLVSGISTRGSEDTARCGLDDYPRSRSRRKSEEHFLVGGSLRRDGDAW